MGSFKSKFKANRYRKPKKELTNLNDDDICYICWEQEKKNTKLIKSPCDCGMLVHGDCLRSYLKSSKRFQCSVCEDFLMKKRVYVIRANGEVEKANFLRGKAKRVFSGDSIFVPVDSNPDDFEITSFISELASTLANIAAILILVDNNNN